MVLILQPELCKVVHAMLPNPINRFSSLVPKITTIEVTAQEQNVTNAFTIASSQLANLRSLLLSTLVGVGEITGRLRLDQR